MTGAKATANGKATKIPEILREPLEAAHVRMGALEEEARRLLEDLMARGRESKREVEHLLHKLSEQDWSLPEMRHRVEKLQARGFERAAEWRGRAEAFRTEAVERVVELQSRAIQFLGAASREQVEQLSREMDRLSRRLDRTQKSTKRPRKSKPSEV